MVHLLFPRFLPRAETEMDIKKAGNPEDCPQNEQI